MPTTPPDAWITFAAYETAAHKLPPDVVGTGTAQTAGYFFYGIIHGQIYSSDGAAEVAPSDLLPDADQTTFEISTIDNADAKDRNHVYCNGEILNGADPATFTVLSSGYVDESGGVNGSFTKDKNHAYIDCALIHDSDAATFRLVRKPSPDYFAFYAKDENHVYFCASYCGPPYNTGDLVELRGADPATFTLVDQFELLPGIRTGLYFPSYYGKDKNHVFDGGDVIDGADPSTFFLFDCQTGLESSRSYWCDKAKDKDNTYQSDENGQWSIVGSTSIQ
jgi:DKNYY family